MFRHTPAKKPHGAKIRQPKPSYLCRSGREAKGKFDGRIFGMHGAALATNDEGRFGPGLRPHPIGQILRPHDPKKAEQGTFPFTENNGPTANNRQLCCFGRIVHALFLLRRGDWKYTREETARVQALRGDRAIVGDVASHLEAARDFLWVIAFDAAAGREVRWAGENEIELLIGLESARVAEVAVADFEAILE